MHFAQLKSLVRSLQFRLMAWNTAVVLLTVLITLFAVREGLRLAMRSEIEALVREDVAELWQAAGDFKDRPDDLGGELERTARRHVHHRLFVNLMNRSGQMEHAAGVAPPPEVMQNLSAIGPQMTYWANYLVTKRDLGDAGLPGRVLILGCAVDHIDRRVRMITRLITFVSGGLLLITPLVGYWLASRATRPVARIIDTASRLHPDRLAERLPKRQTGDELDRLSDTINGLLDRIAAYLERQREFIANAAHELRSPLAAIQSSVDLALNAERTVPDYKELLYSIGDECGELTHLVNQLLTLAEIDSGTSPRTSTVVELQRVTDKCVEMFRGVAEERGIRLIYDVNGVRPVRGNAQQLRQVVNNLLDNALKFTPAGGVVKLQLDEVGEREVRLVVGDTGEGILPEDLPHIFERFYQGNKSRPRELRHRGSGLGLPICEAIVRAHGGRIAVESRPGQGTRMIVTLPAASVTMGDGYARVTAAVS